MTEWEKFTPWIPRRTIDGRWTIGNGISLRRMIDGKWQYRQREETDEEQKVRQW